MHAIGHDYQYADPFRVCLFPGQVARGLLVLDRAAERSDPTARLEIERRARPY